MPQSLSRGKKSIFARQIEAQRVKEGNVSLNAPETVQSRVHSSMEMDQCHPADDRELARLSISSVFTKVALIFISVVLDFRAKAGDRTGASGT